MAEAINFQKKESWVLRMLTERQRKTVCNIEHIAPELETITTNYSLWNVMHYRWSLNGWILNMRKWHTWSMLIISWCIEMIARNSSDRVNYFIEKWIFIIVCLMFHHYLYVLRFATNFCLRLFPSFLKSFAWK